MNPIKFAAPFTGPEEVRAAADVISSGWLVGGPRLKSLEDEFAQQFSASHAVGVSSWTTGAFLTLHAWGIGPGDEVIVPSFSFIATANVVTHVGATVVFADIDPVTRNIDPTDVTRKLTAQTRAIIPVDQVGMPCDIDAINQTARPRGLKVLQDAACAIGSRYKGQLVGAGADAVIFSLHARKLVTTGEGGMILTNDHELASRLRSLRQQGMSISDDKRHASRPSTIEEYPEVGYNFRMTDIQAAIGLVQLGRLPDMVKRRRELARRYFKGLLNHPFLTPPLEPEGYESNWQSYMVELLRGSAFDRNGLMDALFDRGIPTRRGIMASHLEPPYRHLNVSLPVTERMTKNCLLLPMHNGLSDDQADYVLAILTDLVTSRGRGAA
jgi:perosamine synthetase